MNGPYDGYFYNSRSNTLTKIVSPNYPFRVVGGAAWLNGRFYIMTPEGRIYASGINDPYTWSALDFINAIMHPDKGAGVWRHHTYIMAMGKSSTEWFYDSGAAIGNPLRRVDSAAHDFGCMHSGSVVKLKDQTIYVGFSERSREKGVYLLEGYVPKKISTPYIDRIIHWGDVDCIWSFPLFINGHRFYVLNGCCFGMSLVYDLDTNWWFLWDSRRAVSRTATSLTAALDSSSGLVEATVVVSPFAFFEVGLPFKISGATPSVYNGSFVINRVLSNTSFTYFLPTTTVPASPATGTITVLTYDQSSVDNWTSVMSSSLPTGSFPSTVTVVLDRADGDLYAINEEAVTDNMVGTDITYIDFIVRLPRWDAGNNLRKFIPRVEVIGDENDNQMLVRYSDDDYRSWSPFRVVDLDTGRARLSRQGSTRRRSYEIRHPYELQVTDPQAQERFLRLEALELFTKQGSNI